MTDKIEKTALNTSVGADERQSIQKPLTVLYPLPIRKSMIPVKIPKKALRKCAEECSGSPIPVICIPLP